jgi:hypothetical protein
VKVLDYRLAKMLERDGLADRRDLEAARRLKRDIS